MCDQTLYVDLIDYALLVPPTIIYARSQTASHSATVGGNLSLSVQVTTFNIPFASITWMHEGNIVTGHEDRVNIQTSVMYTPSGSVTSGLHIRNVVLEDAGNYTVTIDSSTGNNTVWFKVSISGKASINDIRVSDQPPAHLFLPACFCHYCHY